MTIWQVLFWAWVATEVTIAIVTRTGRAQGKVQDRGSMLLLWATITASITLGSWYSEVHAHTILGGVAWIKTASTALLAAGLVIRWVAIVTLGRSFSVNVAIHATQTVHKTGLFRFVRHPSYSGMLLIFAALGLRTRNWIGLAILFIPPVAALLYRIHVEEAALRQAFGEEYVAYGKVTKRLVPGVY